MKMISARSNNLTHRRDETTPCAFPPLNNSYFALMNKPSAHAPFPTARRRFTDTDTKIVEHCTTQCYQSRSFTYAKSWRTIRLHHNLPFVWSAVFSLFAVWQSATKQSSKQSNRKEIYLSKSTKSYLSKLISSKLHSRIEAVTLIMTVTGCIEYFRSFFYFGYVNWRQTGAWNLLLAETRFTQWPWIEQPTFQLRGGHSTIDYRRTSFVCRKYDNSDQ